MAELDRRNFLKLVGIGAGGAASSACYQYSDLPEKLIPYVVQPEGVTPGIAVEFASTCQECPAGCGLRVRTREGRPVKLEGNPEHPINQGTLCGRGQAAIGRSYHPDRYRGPLRRGSGGALEPISWEEATSLLTEKVGAAGSGAMVLGGLVGPSLGSLIDAYVEASGVGGRITYEPFAYESLREASDVVFGVRTLPVFDLSESDLVVDFGADSLETWLSPVEHQRQIKNARDAATEAGRKARMVSVCARQSMTASESDEWLTAKPGTEGLVALAAAKVAFEARRAAGQAGEDAALESALAAGSPEAASQASGVPADAIRRLGEALAAASRPVALPPGPALNGRNGVATAGAVLLLNAAIGAIGRSVTLASNDGSGAAPANFSEIARLVESMKSGAVQVLLVHDSNPVYSLPAELGFAEALEKVDFVVSFASMPDETSSSADLVLPDHSPLESWGDAAPRAGVRSLIQPTLRPLFDTRATGDVLLEAARAAGAEGLPEGDFRAVVEAGWSRAGHDWRGSLARAGHFEPAPGVELAVAPTAASLEVAEAPLSGDGEWILLTPPSPLLYDGRGANLPWLQETPDPVTKVAWQSWAEVSRGTAEKLGISEGDIVSIETGAGSVEVPIFERGGIRDDVVALAVGQGHSVGRFASAENEGKPGEARGVSALALQPAAQDERGGRAWLTSRAKLTPTGAHRRLPNTQRTDNQRGRQLGMALSLAQLAEGNWNEASRAAIAAGHGEIDHAGGNAEVGVLAAAAAHGDAHGAEHGAADHAAGHGESHEVLRPYDAAEDARDGQPYRWGMSIDVDRCTGCSACVVACAIENNIAQVGEEGVRRNRQMQWIRIERYAGPGEATLLTGRQRPKDREELGDTDIRNAPMLCQQCGAAPCEPVCPVLATYHNDEGLNGMIYNRCIGTRYCSNNCPYKVRRYNWFDYGIENWPEPMQYMLNPDVTVRGQGVMEKCTFCIQRIQTARQGAKDGRRPIADGEVTPACAQTCPSNAIVFGNLRDDESRAATLNKTNEPRSYHALQMLNTRPSITYLAKVNRGEGEKQG